MLRKEDIFNISKMLTEREIGKGSISEARE